MKPLPAIIAAWPELPSLPPPGQPLLIRVRTAATRASTRQELRTVLRQVLAAWTEISPEHLPLQETARGPVWPGLIAGHALDISLAYAANEAWIALLRGGRVGVDAMLVTKFAEADAVSRLYLGPDVGARIRRSADPDRAFALAWTEFEARVKCLKGELGEWSATSAHALSRCGCRHHASFDQVVVAVASHPDFASINATRVMPGGRMSPVWGISAE